MSRKIRDPIRASTEKKVEAGRVPEKGLGKHRKRVWVSTREGFGQVPRKGLHKYRRRVRASNREWWNSGEYQRRVRASTEKAPGEYRRRVRASTGEGSGQVPEKGSGKYRKWRNSGKYRRRVRVSTGKGNQTRARCRGTTELKGVGMQRLRL